MVPTCLSCKSFFIDPLYIFFIVSLYINKYMLHADKNNKNQIIWLLHNFELLAQNVAPFNFSQEKQFGTRVVFSRFLLFSGFMLKNLSGPTEEGQIWIVDEAASVFPFVYIYVSLCIASFLLSDWFIFYVFGLFWCHLKFFIQIFIKFVFRKNRRNRIE